MGIIVPAILPSSEQDLTEKLARINGIADRVQIDIVDGRYATPATWPYSSGKKEFNEGNTQGGFLSGLGSYRFEIDLMVDNPEVVAGTWIMAGATRITIHAESTKFLSRLLSDFETIYGHDKDFAPDLLSIGLALNVDSDIALVEPHIEKIDYVQVMGIARIGRQGEPYDARVLERISELRAKFPTLQLQVDGGVSLATAPALLTAGVTNLIVGSALLGAPDVGLEMQKFQALTEEFGLYQ